MRRSIDRRARAATRLGAALLAAALLGAVAPAAAQRPPAPAPAPAVEAVTTVDLEVNKGSLIRLAKPASAVFIADPKIADVQVKSPTLIYVFGREAGETSLVAVDGDDRTLLDRRVTVRHNLSRLRESMKAVLPHAAIDVASIDGAILLDGAVASAVEASDAVTLAQRFVAKEERVLSRIKVVGPNQINLQVRVAEVSREVIKELGFNWDAVFASGSIAFGLATGNPVVAGAALLTRNGDTNSLFGSIRRGNFDVNSVLDALDNEGLISILAQPSLTAVSGETASFLAGGEFPIPVPQDNNSITIEFKRFGVSLSFTPTILEANLISLRVRPEVSQLSQAGAIQIQNFTIPALTTRRAETTIELGSGQSFAIAGLLQSNLNHDLSKFPGLGDLPVLGPLFRSDRFERNETELVIIVTPYVVRPVNTRLAAPNDGLHPTTDMERLLDGKVRRQAPAPATPGPTGALPAPLAIPAPPATASTERGLIGPLGFILD